MALQERFLYHCWPRRGRNGAAECERGLRVLSSIRDSGLLLTPEIVPWRYPHADGSAPRVERILQKRVCFTELTPPELQGHAEEFGRFALEFTTQNVRKLGSIPVFYIPTLSQTQGTTLEDLGAMLVIQLLDAKRLANHISVVNDTFNLRNATPEIEFSFKYAENPKSEGKFKLRAEEAKQTLAAVTHGLTPPPMLREGINAVLNFFYPADNHHHSKELSYYQQREWRITGNITLRGVNVMRNVKPHEVEILLGFDPEFFGKKLSFPPNEFSLLSESLMYPGFEGKHMMEFVNRVIVPASAIEEAKAILRKLDRPPTVVPLETLAG